MKVKNKIFAVFAILAICMVFPQIGIGLAKADASVNVMITQADGSYTYSQVTLTDLTGYSAFNATQLASNPAVEWYYGSWGIYVNGLNGVTAPANGYWELYTWDSVNTEWVPAMAGAGGLTLAAGDTIGWVLNPDWSISPDPVPTDPTVPASPAVISLSTPPSGLAVGDTFTVTASITNAVNVQQWAIENFAYNPSVLNCTGITAGTFITNPQAFFTPIDYVNGVIPEMCIASSTGTGSSGSGSLVTMTFKVVGYGSSNFVIQYAVLKNTSVPAVFSDTQNMPMTYIGQSAPTPYGPTAVISSPTNGLFKMLGTSVSCDGTQSLNGFTGTTTDWIWWYNWTITTPSSTVIENPGDGSYYPYDLTLDEVGDWTITLTVQTDPAGLNQTDSETVVVHVLPALSGPSLDVYTNHGGYYNMTNSTGYAPQELINLYANVTYNGAPVVNKDVTFEVRDASGNLIAVRTARSDVNGVAVAEYRLPWPDTSSPEGTFGVWSVSATVDISQTINYDRVCFIFDYMLEITDLSTSASSVVRGNQITVSMTVRNIDTLSHDCLATITLYDEAHVPIGVFTVTGTVPAASGAVAGVYPATSGVYTFTNTFTVPTYAFVGLATAYGDVLTGLPSVGGVVYCPEASTNFSITI